MRFLPSLSLPVALSLAACVQSSGTKPEAARSHASFDQILLEGQRLAELFSLRSLVLAALVIGAALVMNQALQRLTRVLWRLGLDTDRRLAGPASLFSLCLAALVVVFLAHATFRVAPLFTTLLTLALCGGALLTSGYLADAVAGIGLIVRRTLRVGDRVTIGEQVGIVREISLTKLELRGSDGSTIIVPHRLMTRHALNIERARNTVPVHVGVELTEPSQAIMRALKRSLLLSPYRAPGTSVDVTANPVNRRFCSFEVQVWSARATSEAHAQLQATLEHALQALRESPQASRR